MGKKSAWEAWQALEDVTDIFVYLANHPFKHLNVIVTSSGRLTIIMYDRTSHLSFINEARE